MPFDPNQPFEVIDAQPPIASFDPNQPFEVISTQGGEQNEDNEQSQPEANTDSDEQRQGNEQVQPPNEAGVQPSGVRLPEPQGEEQRVGNIDPNLTATTQATTGGETIAKENQQAPEGSQGQEDGQGLRGQVPSGNEAQVSEEKGTSVPSAVSKIIGGVTSPFGFIGESGWNAIAGIQRALGYTEAAEESSFTANQSVEDIARMFGGTPVDKGGYGETAGKIAGALIELPALAGGGLIEGAVGSALAVGGLATLLTKGFGESKEGLYQNYLSKGLSEEEANKKSSSHAAITTAVAAPLYYFSGGIAGKMADSFIAESVPRLIDGIARVGIGTGLNSVASAVSRGFAAGIEGEDVMEAFKDVSIEGFAQDFFFAGLSHASHIKGLERQGKIQEAVSSLSDPLLAEYGQLNPNAEKFVKVEQAKRETERLTKEAESAGLPETARVVAEPIQQVDPIQTEDATEPKGKWHSSDELKQWDEEKTRLYDTWQSLPLGSDERIAARDKYRAHEELQPKGRIVDLTRLAAKEIGIFKHGIGKVLVQKVEKLANK